MLQRVQETPYWQGYWLDAIRNLFRDSTPSDYWGHQVGSCASKQVNPATISPRNCFQLNRRMRQSHSILGGRKGEYFGGKRGQISGVLFQQRQLPTTTSIINIVISRFLETSTKKSNRIQQAMLRRVSYPLRTLRFLHSHVSPNSPHSTRYPSHLIPCFLLIPLPSPP